MPYQGNLVAAMACPPANFVITPLALPESSSPQCWDVKEVPASSCPAPEDSCLVFKSARWFPYHWLQQSTRGMINWRKNELIKVAPFGARVVVVVVGWGGAKQEKTIPTQQLSIKPVPFIIFSFHWTSSSAWYRITDLSWMRSSLSSAPNSAVVVVWMKTRQLDTNSLTPENDRGWYEGLRMRTSSDNLVNHQWMVIAYLSGMVWLSAGVLLHGISRQQTSAVSGGFIFYFYFFRFPFRILRVANAHRLWCCKSQLFHRMRVIEPYHNSKSWSIFMHSHMMIFIQRRMIWRDWTQPNFLLQSHLVTPTSNQHPIQSQ